MGKCCYCCYKDEHGREPEYLWEDWALDFGFPHIAVPSEFVGLITEEELNSIPPMLKEVADAAFWHWCALFWLFFFIITSPIAIWNICVAIQKVKDEMEEINQKMLLPKGMRMLFFSGNADYRYRQPNRLAIYLVKNDSNNYNPVPVNESKSTNNVQANVNAQSNANAQANVNAQANNPQVNVNADAMAPQADVNAQANVNVNVELAEKA